MDKITDERTALVAGQVLASEHYVHLVRRQRDGFRPPC